MWSKVWSWLKRYWYWVVLPVLLLLVIFPRGRRIVVANLQGVNTDEAIRLHDEEIKKREEEAQKAYEARVKEIEGEHQATIEKFDADQKITYQELKEQAKSDPQKLTNWLLDVGKGKK